MVKYLRVVHADINLKNEDGSISLMHASENRQLEIVKYLIETNGDVTAGSRI